MVNLVHKVPQANKDYPEKLVSPEDLDSLVRLVNVVKEANPVSKVKQVQLAQLVNLDFVEFKAHAAPKAKPVSKDLKDQMVCQERLVFKALLAHVDHKVPRATPELAVHPVPWDFKA